MEFIATDIDGLVKIQPAVHRDHRGFFLESYTEDTFVAAGITSRFVQDNHSCSVERGVIRGLHFQRSPFAQAKLVRVLRGAIFDVAVDLRRSSPTFGAWRGFELTADNFTMLYIPAGFAHGFCTLLPDTEVFYKVDAPYSPRHDAGIRWDDPRIKVEWPDVSPILSDKDCRLPLLDDSFSAFDAAGS